MAEDVKEPAEETVSEASPEKATAEDSDSALFETVEMSDMTTKEHEKWLHTGDLPERFQPKAQREKGEKKTEAKAEPVKAKEKTEVKAEEKSKASAKASTTTKDTEEAEQTASGSDPEKKEKQETSTTPINDRADKRNKQLSDQIRERANQKKTLEAEVAELEKRKAVLADSAAAKPATEAKKEPELVLPDINDFETTADYKKAMGEYLEKREKALRAETNQAIKDALKQDREARAEQAEKDKREAENTKVRDSWKKQIAASNQRHKDYADVALADDIPGLMEGDIDSIMDSFILRKAYGSEVLYELGLDHDHAAEIRDMDNYDKVIALGRLHDKIEASLKTPPAKKEEDKTEDKEDKPPVSRAPKPPMDVSGTKKAPDDEALAALEADDFRAYARTENSRELALKGGTRN